MPHDVEGQIWETVKNCPEVFETRPIYTSDGTIKDVVHLIKDPFDPGLTDMERYVIDRVLHEYGQLDLEKLCSAVRWTYPMTSQREGTYLNLSELATKLGN